MGESDNTAVVCRQCGGTGKYHYTYEYEEFTGKKVNEKIDRVYLKNYGYKIGTGMIPFKIGDDEQRTTIDMDKEGVSYEEFLVGKMPGHIKPLACPMMADQPACHNIKDFTDKCNKLNGGWINLISRCGYQEHKDECWKRFEEGK